MTWHAQWRAVTGMRNIGERSREPSAKNLGKRWVCLWTVTIVQSTPEVIPASHWGGLIR